MNVLQYNIDIPITADPDVPKTYPLELNDVILEPGNWTIKPEIVYVDHTTTIADENNYLELTSVRRSLTLTPPPSQSFITLHNNGIRIAFPKEITNYASLLVFLSHWPTIVENEAGQIFEVDITEQFFVVNWKNKPDDWTVTFRPASELKKYFNFDLINNQEVLFRGWAPYRRDTIYGDLNIGLSSTPINLSDGQVDTTFKKFFIADYDFHQTRNKFALQSRTLHCNVDHKQFPKSASLTVHSTHFTYNAQTNFISIKFVKH